MNNKNKCGIYRIKCESNGLYYIGQSINIRNRIINHKRDLKLNKHVNKHLQNAYNKYKLKNFTFEIIEECEQELLNEKEIFWIEKYDSYNCGFNQTIGGEGTVGKFHSEQYKINLSKRQKELGINKKPIIQYSLDGEIIKKWDSATDVYLELGYDFSTISKVCKGKIKNARGYVWRYDGEPFDKYETKNKERNKITQYDLDGNKIKVYENGHKAYLELGFSDGEILKCCKGIIDECYGYVWRYNEDLFSKPRKNKRKNNRIVQLTKDGNFVAMWSNLKSITSSLDGTSEYPIRACLRGTQIFHFGFKWVKEYDYDNKTDLYYKILELKENPKHENVVMIDLKTAKIIKSFNSIREASKETKIGESIISSCCNNRLKHAGGYYWRKTGDKIDIEYVLNIEKTKGSAKKSIIMKDLQSGEHLKIFDSLYEATEYLTGVRKSSSSISSVLTGRINKAYGYGWEYNI